MHGYGWDKEKHAWLSHHRKILGREKALNYLNIEHIYGLELKLTLGISNQIYDTLYRICLPGRRISQDVAQMLSLASLFMYGFY